MLWCYSRCNLPVNKHTLNRSMLKTCAPYIHPYVGRGFLVMLPSEMNLRDMNKCHSSLMYPAATWLLLSKTPWFLVRLYLAKSKPKSKLVLVFTCVITALATCLMVMPIDLIKLLDCQNAFGHALPWIPSLIRFTFSMYWNMEGN